MLGALQAMAGANREPITGGLSFLTLLCAPSAWHSRRIPDVQRKGFSPFSKAGRIYRHLA
jgi:hypothetical protein